MTPLRLEILEEKVLLSSATGDPAKSAVVENAKPAKPFVFNGKLYVGFAGHYNPVLNEYYSVSLTPGLYEKTPFPPMGPKVHVSGSLAHPKLLPAGALPDLGDSTFVLSNKKGNLSVTFSPSTTNTYRFTISAGTNQFVKADQTVGTAVFSANRKADADVITFKSSS